MPFWVSAERPTFSSRFYAVLSPTPGDRVRVEYVTLMPPIDRVCLLSVINWFEARVCVAGDAEEAINSPQNKHLRIENKNFYFDIKRNQQGRYMSISEVVYSCTAG